MIPTLHPQHDMRYRETPCGLEAEMSQKEALAVLDEKELIEWWQWSNRASALYLIGNTEEALATAYHALQMKRSVPTLVNVAVILETLGQFDAALHYAKEAYTFDPKDNRASSIYGEGLLRMGRFEEGWPHYVKNRTALNWLRPHISEWMGQQDLFGKRILVVEGGGYGDNIYFLRWLDHFRRWGASVDYICQPSFAPLVRHLGYRAIENWQGNIDIRYDDYDYFTGLLALGLKFGMSLDNPGPIRYIKGNWMSRLKKLKPTFRVGICWRAGEATSPRKQRSLTSAHIDLILSRLPSCELVNLTHGEFILNEPGSKVLYSDWLETANAIAACDLVISVDTGVAHLAGAMGIRTWVPLPGSSAWQFPLGHMRHPFYPSMEMFWNHGEGMDHSVSCLAKRLESM